MASSGSGGGWLWSWLGGLFSTCSAGGAASYAEVTISPSPSPSPSSSSSSESRRLTGAEEQDHPSPIISLAALERQGRAKFMMEERTLLNSETEQIQQILTIVEGLRQQHSSPLFEDHLVAELRRIFQVFDHHHPYCGDLINENGARTGNSSSSSSSFLVLNSATAASSRLLSLTVVRNVLTWARRHLVATPPSTRGIVGPEAPDAPGRFDTIKSGDHHNDAAGLDSLISSLVAALNPLQQTELFSILQGLPPAVLGDEDAQEETRVFVDIKKDIREAQKQEALKVERRQQLVEVVTGVVVELIQTLGPTVILSSTDSATDKGKEKDVGGEPKGQGSSIARIAASLLECVEERDRLRLVMEQLLLGSAKWLPKDHANRDALLRTIFHRSSDDNEDDTTLASAAAEFPLILLPPPATANTTTTTEG